MMAAKKSSSAAAAASSPSSSTTSATSSTSSKSSMDESVYNNLSDLSTSTANDVLSSKFEQLRQEANGNLVVEIPAAKTAAPTKIPSRSLTNLSRISSKHGGGNQQQHPNEQLYFTVTTDEDDCVMGELDAEKMNVLKFKLKMLNLIIEQKASEHQEIHVYGEAREEDVEWRFLAQVRILTTINEENFPLRVVDYDIFEFSNRTNPLILINRDDRLSHIRLEFRYIHQFYEKLPNFTEECRGGDLLLNFDDGKPPLKVHSALMALYSPYMAKLVKEFQCTEFLASGKEAKIDMKECERQDFIEVLYQIYSQARPLWADFRRVSRGAVAYQFLPIIERISKHLVDYEMPIIQKMKEAIKLGIDNAVGELAFIAAKKDIWHYLISTGFNPKIEFGVDVYHRLICPALIQAKKTPHFARYRTPYKLPYSLEAPTEAEKPFVVPLKVSGKTFYSNKGILQLYNDSELATGNNGERYFRITVDLLKYLESKDLRIQEVIEAMLNYMNPQNRRIRIEFVRPIIMLANEHKMYKLLKEMEQLLVDEPPITSEILMDHLEFAQKYNLKNVIGQTLLRIEVNFVNVAYHLIDTEIFKKHISKELQNKIMDRIVSGWGQTSWRLADCIPTKKLRRFIEAENGGPTSNNDAALVTFNEVNSYYAFGDPHHLAIKME